MCQKCKGLEVRVTGLAQRIDRSKPWTAFAYQVRRSAYDNLLRSIMGHMYESGHEVDSFPVMMALGKRVRN